MAIILVADDEEPIRKLICSIVARDGHRTLAAANGLEAVALFRSNKSLIDLVVTDMRMPVMGGAEAIVHMRETRPDIPIICITGFTREKVPEGAVLIEKPFTASILRAAIERLLNH